MTSITFSQMAQALSHLSLRDALSAIQSRLTVGPTYLTNLAYPSGGTLGRPARLELSDVRSPALAVTLGHLERGLGMLGHPGAGFEGALLGVLGNPLPYVHRHAIHGRDCSREEETVNNNALAAVFLICVTVLVALGMACCTFAL